MGRPHEPLDSALVTLRTRWGSAAVRLGNGGPGGTRQPAMEAGPATHGALALATLPDPVTDSLPSPGAFGEVVSTGFPALDAILGTQGLPREVGAAFRGGPSSGKTTLALRCVASSQEQGAIVAWLDLARGVRPGGGGRPRGGPALAAGRPSGGPGRGLQPRCEPAVGTRRWTCWSWTCPRASGTDGRAAAAPLRPWPARGGTAHRAGARVDRAVVRGRPGGVRRRCTWTSSVAPGCGSGGRSWASARR